MPLFSAIRCCMADMAQVIVIEHIFVVQASFSRENDSTAPIMTEDSILPFGSPAGRGRSSSRPRTAC